MTNRSIRKARFIRSSQGLAPHYAGLGLSRGQCGGGLQVGDHQLRRVEPGQEVVYLVIPEDEAVLRGGRLLEGADHAREGVRQLRLQAGVLRRVGPGPCGHVLPPAYSVGPRGAPVKDFHAGTR